jgi:hypothetical protein
MVTSIFEVRYLLLDNRLPVRDFVFFLEVEKLEVRMRLLVI